jgi:hypothetical protein
MDWVIAWSIDDYVDWDRHQQIDFDVRVDKVLLWHQATQLSRYSFFLNQLQQDLQQPLTKKLLLLRLNEMQVLWNSLLIKLEPDIIALLETLNERQVSEMHEALYKATTKVEKKYAGTDKDELDKDRIERVEKFLNRFVGKLNDQQKTIVQQWGDNTEDSRDEWINSRKKWSRVFMAALDVRDSPIFATNINALFIHPQSLWNDKYLLQTKINTANTIDMIIALQLSLTDKQRLKLNKEIDQWEKLFDELAAEVSEADGAFIP